MKRSEMAKIAGLDSFKEMAEITGWTTESLRKMKWKRFKTLLNGAALQKLRDNLKRIEE